MTDNYVRLQSALHRTREDFLEACRLLDIDPKLIDPHKLEVAQCVECAIWESISNIEEGDVCRFCYDMPDLRF